MLSQKAKDLFAKLELEYAPVAVKFSYKKPENTKHIDKVMSFCQFMREAQDTNEKFYMTAENENCNGKMITGMEKPSPLGASGQVGADFGVFRNQAPNARLYSMLPLLREGTVNYVTFCPVEKCDFDPDLVLFVALPDKAEIIMRATSYISGDLWESKSSYVIGCAWMFIYPYLSGKVNRFTTGMHHGMKRRKIYPAGREIISVPYQKLDELVEALGEMDWVPITMREDEESRRIVKERMDAWADFDPELKIGR